MVLGGWAVSDERGSPAVLPDVYQQKTDIGRLLSRETRNLYLVQLEQRNWRVFVGFKGRIIPAYLGKT